MRVVPKDWAEHEESEQQFAWQNNISQLSFGLLQASHSHIYDTIRNCGHCFTDTFEIGNRIHRAFKDNGPITLALMDSIP